LPVRPRARRGLRADGRQIDPERAQPTPETPKTRQQQGHVNLPLEPGRALDLRGPLADRVLEWTRSTPGDLVMSCGKRGDGACGAHAPASPRAGYVRWANSSLGRVGWSWGPPTRLRASSWTAVSASWTTWRTFSLRSCGVRPSRSAPSLTRSTTVEAACLPR